MENARVYNCPFEVTLGLIGGKWKGFILWYLSENEPLRNGELMRLIPSITQKMLTQQLREMEENGLIVRKIYEQVPPKVEYSLTPHGQKLKPVLEAMKDWGLEYAMDNGMSMACSNGGQK